MGWREVLSWQVTPRTFRGLVPIGNSSEDDAMIDFLGRAEVPKLKGNLKELKKWMKSDTAKQLYQIIVANVGDEEFTQKLLRAYRRRYSW